MFSAGTSTEATGLQQEQYRLLIGVVSGLRPAPNGEAIRTLDSTALTYVVYYGVDHA